MSCASNCHTNSSTYFWLCLVCSLCISPPPPLCLHVWLAKHLWTGRAGRRFVRKYTIPSDVVVCGIQIQCHRDPLTQCTMYAHLRTITTPRFRISSSSSSRKCARSRVGWWIGCLSHVHNQPEKKGESSSRAHAMKNTEIDGRNVVLFPKQRGRSLRGCCYCWCCRRPPRATLFIFPP